MVDSKEDYKWDLGRERVNQDFSGKQSIFGFFFFWKNNLCTILIPFW